jgi:hypothetical protein
MFEAAATFALLGGVLGAAESIPYVRDTWRRTTVPHRGSWLIWGVIEVVAVESQLADGARWSLVPLIAQAVGTCVVFALSIWLGSGGLTRVELTLIALAGVGLLGWLVADEPVIATACVIVADFVAAIMMLPKAWSDPDSETLSTYGLASLAGMAAVGSVGGPSLPLLMYPVYFALINASLTLVIAYRRTVLRRPDPVGSLPGRELRIGGPASLFGLTPRAPGCPNAAQDEAGSRRDPTELHSLALVIANGPVLGDESVEDALEVHLADGERLVGRRKGALDIAVRSPDHEVATVPT